MRFEYDDGGRAEAGYKGEARDCSTRAIAIATGQSYKDVYDSINALCKEERIGERKKSKKASARTGAPREILNKHLQAQGWKWVPTMQIGSGCRVHLRDGELPEGRVIARLSKHLVAIVDGVIRDTHDPSRDCERCVYGYWIQDS